MDQQLQSALTDIRGSVETILNRHKSLQTQVDAIDVKLADKFSAGPAPAQSLETKLRENDTFSGCCTTAAAAPSSH